MTNPELQALMDGPTWAKVQNALAQGIDAAKQEAFDAFAKQLAEANAAKDAAEKALADYKAQVSAGIGAIKAAVLDPGTPTEETVLAIIHEATKDERTKQREALVAEIRNKQAELDALK